MSYIIKFEKTFWKKFYFVNINILSYTKLFIEQTKSTTLNLLYFVYDKLETVLYVIFFQLYYVL